MKLLLLAFCFIEAILATSAVLIHLSFSSTSLFSLRMCFNHRSFSPVSNNNNCSSKEFSSSCREIGDANSRSRDSIRLLTTTCLIWLIATITAGAIFVHGESLSIALDSPQSQDSSSSSVLSSFMVLMRVLPFCWVSASLVFFGLIFDMSLNQFDPMQWSAVQYVSPKNHHQRASAQTVIMPALSAIGKPLAPAALTALWINFFLLVTFYDLSSNMNKVSNNNTEKEYGDDGLEMTKVSMNRCVEWSTAAGIFVYLALFLLVALKRWNGKFRYCCQPMGMRLPQQDSYDNYGFESVRLDEYKWYEWTNSQVLQWMEDVLGKQFLGERTSDHGLDNSKDVLHRILNECLARLDWEKLQGSQLEGLSLTELRKLSGMPYGLARFLMDRIIQMTQQHPNPNRLQPNLESMVPHFSLHPNDPLYSHFSRFGDNGGDPMRKTNYDPHHQTRQPREQTDSEYIQPTNSASVPVQWDMAEMSEEMEQEAQNIMRERFGLELPPLIRQQKRLDQQQKLQQPRNADQSYQIHGYPLSQHQPSLVNQRTNLATQILSEAGQSQTSHLISQSGNSPASSSGTKSVSSATPPPPPPPPPAASKQPVNVADETGVVLDLPPSVIANMPPDISEIVRTRPDLVQKAMCARRKKQELQSSLTPLFDQHQSSPNHRQSLRGGGSGVLGLGSSVFIGGQARGDGNTIDEADEEERANLLQNSPLASKYKSVF